MEDDELAEAINASIRERRHDWQGFATFRCTNCEQTFSGLLPPFYENMPTCPDCQSGPVQLVELLAPAGG
jgi:hypothetical protein